MVKSSDGQTGRASSTGGGGLPGAKALREVARGIDGYHTVVYEGICASLPMGEFIDYKTSMITDEDPLRGLLFWWDLGFSHTRHVLTKKGDGGANTSISGSHGQILSHTQYQLKGSKKSNTPQSRQLKIVKKCHTIS